MSVAQKMKNATKKPTKPNCERYRPEPEIRELLQRLIDGIESWAADEDGVHPDCWEAYKAACAVVGQWDRVKESA